MEEKKVTIGNETLTLPSPFVVFATQNPLEHEGTYPLPEAQLDRFLMRIVLDYPSKYDEKKILMQESGLRHSDEGRIQDSEASEHRSFVTQDDETGVKLSSSDLLEMIEYI
jgi:MoxR-like ATPase